MKSINEQPYISSIKGGNVEIFTNKCNIIKCESFNWDILNEIKGIEIREFFVSRWAYKEDSKK
tara:strand:+ start:353 stop:541 length:189 start_codon:yes stop_codon:yes gene_type:complete